MGARPGRAAAGTAVDPVMLEIFNNLFMSVAEQMGVRLQSTAHSVNIKERLDFSCAIFDARGKLIANEEGVLAGLPIFKRVFELLDKNITFEPRATDALATLSDHLSRLLDLVHRHLGQPDVTDEALALAAAEAGHVAEHYGMLRREQHQQDVDRIERRGARCR